jgi:hypothetical protein
VLAFNTYLVPVKAHVDPNISDNLTSLVTLSSEHTLQNNLNLETVRELPKTQAYKKTGNEKYLCPYWNQCVCYAKTLVGNYGTWGNGGRNLSGNSGPMVGVVIIFNYNHVGVITHFDGYNIGYTDRNGRGDRRIRELVWTTVDDPTILKYHKF